jgi:antirestriction protein ArdC
MKTKTRTPSQTRKAETAAAERTALMDQLAAFEDDTEAQDDVRITHFAQHYSTRNAMLIVMQAPEATEVHGYNAWQELGRQVRRGEHGIRILAPAGRSDDVQAQPATDSTPGTEGKKGRQFFRLVSVFDISQTVTHEEAAAEAALHT